MENERHAFHRLQALEHDQQGDAYLIRLDDIAELPFPCSAKLRKVEKARGGTAIHLQEAHHLVHCTAAKVW